MTEPRELTISAAVEQLRQGQLTVTALMTSCLDRIHLRDKTVKAWVEVYEKEAIDLAGRYDADLRAGKWHGPLHGIPFGVKDIIDVKGMWTRAGCSVYPARLAESDAPAVKHLRRAGAIILGKTVTTAFANNDPSITCNPWNTGHTPGGSSSGSAAAVADRMCLAALGSQTGGSVLRPAAYNGVVGFKPTYATISTKAVIPVSWTLDHVGLHTRNVEDAGIVYNVAKVDRPSPFGHMPAATGRRDASSAAAPFRFGYFRSFIEATAGDEVVRHLDAVQKRFEAAGASFEEIELSESFAAGAAAHRTIMDTELASYHRTLFEVSAGEYPPFIRKRINTGLKMAGYRYVDAVHRRITFQQELSAALSGVDAAFMPTAPSTAPKGLASTGSPVFCVPWSLAGFPSITIPSGLDDQGLPLAIQLGAHPRQEEKLLSIAAWCEKQLQFTSRPV